VIHFNLLNKVPHPSTLISPITINVEKEADILRVHLKKGLANLYENCDIMIDQPRAFDNNYDFQDTEIKNILNNMYLILKNRNLPGKYSIITDNILHLHSHLHS